MLLIGAIWSFLKEKNSSWKSYLY